MKKLILLVTVALISTPVIAQHLHLDSPQTQTLQAIPDNIPAWMYNKQRNHIYPQRGVYNNAIYNVRDLALDLNAIAVGHAFAYEDIVTGKAKDLETKTYQKINLVLKNPPKFMPDEGNISPTFGRKYGVLEQVFEWAHIFHAQTVDVLASSKLTNKEKEAEIEKLYQFYLTKVPYAISGLPMNMGYLDSQPYSKAFRQKYPKVNGLFWGYHWLQGTMYDLLYEKTLEEQKQAYKQVGKQYHSQELYRTDRAFMPMFAELSPKFARRFPEISNTFDNLHMLHDMVNDILASDWLTTQQKDEQITRAIWLVMAANHQGMEAGKNYGGEGLHDHRFESGIPGMGLMPADISHEDHNHENPHNSEKKPDNSQGHEGGDYQHHNHENYSPENPPNTDKKPGDSNDQEEMKK
ncbi:MAG: hypothetical protein GPJ27_06170 [Microcystis aeruginosa L111-01]|jgi:hypothetical protein|nr:hypothetical protein [Microcystis aeruginosa W13-16]NCQ73366.1 hypothetical protein [Microcystis aeruginosa W13-13]NCQ77861.1 hypothetical protein [Microcystis aeruginosa W13-15]NCR21529.1 hypothetical protein [Microcystis aeruginosa L111-01]NCS45503.1 hypothetical protein [Microcystis aeruginosa BS11-05]NCS51700.1 hypothetical protein [Microcystis aeruginosa G13-05]TRU55830.1 MAG: hypothetical protein EWV56_19665 [Microcystis aeruginosa Ma_QC_C_20070823_S13D]TRU61631.1 MAG: hypothetical 